MSEEDELEAERAQHNLTPSTVLQMLDALPLPPSGEDPVTLSASHEPSTTTATSATAATDTTALPTSLTESAPDYSQLDENVDPVIADSIRTAVLDYQISRAYEDAAVNRALVEKAKLEVYEQAYGREVALELVRRQSAQWL